MSLSERLEFEGLDGNAGFCFVSSIRKASFLAMPPRLTGAFDVRPNGSSSLVTDARALLGVWWRCPRPLSPIDAERASGLGGRGGALRRGAATGVESFDSLFELLERGGGLRLAVWRRGAAVAACAPSPAAGLAVVRSKPCRASSSICQALFWPVLAFCCGSIAVKPCLDCSTDWPACDTLGRAGGETAGT